MTPTIPDPVKDRLNTLSNVFADDGELEVASIFDLLAAGEPIREKVDAISLDELLGLATALHTAAAALREMGDEDVAGWFEGFAAGADKDLARRSTAARNRRLN